MTGVSNTDRFQDALRRLDPATDAYAVDLVELILGRARQLGVSDIHFQPTASGIDIRWRVDGVLQEMGCFQSGESADPITRLKVLADLLTYRQDIPQEGRLRERPDDVEMRISTFPTLRGERAVVRLFAKSEQPWCLDHLGLPNSVQSAWHRLLGETSGALMICGPAGSGKTTTAYASLRQVVSDSAAGRSVVTIEDPIEVELPGVAQSQVNPASEFTMASALRSLLRQDPEVIFVGEVRDPEAARMTFQAALTGQLAISTFHANSAAAAISRLADMNIEPYVLRSGVRAILHQRLVRRLCNVCKAPIECERQLAGWKLSDASKASGPVGCEACHRTGYEGRLLLTELLLPMQGNIQKELLSRSEVSEIEAAAVKQGMVTIRQRAIEAIQRGITSPIEARRVLGFGSSGGF